MAKTKRKKYQSLNQYFRYFKRYPWLVAGLWISLLGTAVLSLLGPWFLGKLIASLTTYADYDATIKYAIIFMVIEFAGLIVYNLRVPCFKKLENYVKRDVKLEILGSSFDINIGQFEKLGNGVFITRLTNDLNSLATSFRTISETIVDFFSKIGFVVFVFVLNYWIGLFLLGFILIRYFVYQIRVHFYAKMKPGVFKREENINSLIGESIRGIKDIKTLGLSAKLLDKTRLMQEDYAKADNKEWYVGTTMYGLANIVQYLCNFFFILISVYLISQGNLEIAVFYTIYTYKGNVMNFALQLGNLQNYFKELDLSASRVFELANEAVYEHDKFGNVVLPAFNGNIEFKNVSFAYEENSPVLDDVSFSVSPNNHIAFVGESGCGKSTIVALICKLYDPTQGVILFDETNSLSLDKSFGKYITMVNQSPYMFNMTIRENMQLVEPNVTDEEIYHVLKLANAYDFVSVLPDGLDSFLGEGGTRLSGGQKQRLCIARALLKKDSKVIIFDEATSALDNISQDIVINNLDTLKKDRVIITIAHRLSTIENCDKIYFVEHGKIVSEGTHQELLTKNKTYAALYKKQKKENTEAE